MISYTQAPMNGNATFMMGGDEEVPPMVDQKMKVKSLTCVIDIYCHSDFPAKIKLEPDFCPISSLRRASSSARRTKSSGG